MTMHKQLRPLADWFNCPNLTYLPTPFLPLMCLMIPFLFIFLFCLERTHSLVVIGNEHRTYLHTQATFSPGYISGRVYRALLLL